MPHQINGNLRWMFFFMAAIFHVAVYGNTVTKLKGKYKHGQVFLTWKNLSADVYYKVYRSTSPIVNSIQLAGCEYLGHTDNNSAQDHNLSAHNGVVSYFRIDSNDIPLNSGTGLFVATTLEDGSYYYAVTTVLNEMEDISVNSGANATVLPIGEAVATVMPVFQQHFPIGSETVDIYTTFYSTKRAVGEALQNKAGYISLDFAVNPHFSGEGLHAIEVFFHGGGEDFLWNMQKPPGNLIQIGMEDILPNEESDLGYGSNENYDFYKDNTENQVPVTGINYDYQQEITKLTIDWALMHFPADSNRIYLKGTSMGAGSAFMYAIAHPEKIAAVFLSVPCFNYSFEHDYDPDCALNEGNQARLDGDIKFGTVNSNLMSNKGIPFYNAVNGGWIIHAYREKNFPMIFAINGKHDEMVGWTEKTIFYDSVKANHTGGYFFWDQRNHAGVNSTWNDAAFDLFRYASNRSFPAFAHCSNDEDYGIGDDITGAAFGTVNGSLDWDESSIADSTTSWEVKLFARNLYTKSGQLVNYPDSCTADITPRRLQHCIISPGAVYAWTVTHDNTVVQSGQQVYNGGLIVLPGIKIYKDSCLLKVLLTAGNQLFFYDSDGDGYGDADVFIQSNEPLPGYVADSTDCDDANSSIHPGAVDYCNTMDDNCNGATDDHQMVAIVDPVGNITICDGAEIILTANNDGDLIYQWYKNGNSIAGATNAALAVNKKGNYTVSEMNSYDCSSVSDKTKVAVMAAPLATIIPLGDLDICSTGFVLLQANDGLSFAYQWLKGNATIEGATDQVYAATKKGNYKVTVTNGAGCSKTSAAQKVVNSCKEDPSDGDLQTGSRINCYPNPTTGSFILELQLQHATPVSATIEIWNMMNQLMIRFEATIEGDALHKSITGDTLLADGIYLVNVRTGGQVLTCRLIIQK
ncbi:MAG: T9SS type A sorting domain-containing protein [Chitinophagales bacterium]|nr:T9SS type A sorting domain-containing protein [Chitinophagales bacterium]